MRLRLAVFRSNKSIYAQIIDDKQTKTLVAASEKDLDKKTLKNKITKTEKARLIGKILAKKAIDQKIKQVFFDRRDYRYHGRVKALAEGAREGGLQF